MRSDGVRATRRPASVRLLPIALAILTLGGLAGTLTLLAQPGWSEHAGLTRQGGLVISEAMSKNLGSFRAPDGSTPDWIELHNTSGKAISLKGYMLSENPRKPDKYVFQAGVIEPGDYLLLYAVGKKAGSPGAIYLPFRLSSAGEPVSLIAPDGKVADQLTIPAMPADVSYGRNGPDAASESAKVYFAEPTPGGANRRDGKPTLEAAVMPKTTTLLINEYCTRNTTLRDEAGDAPDWVELYNSGTEPLDLTGYALSDDLTKLGKWRFPKYSLAPKAYLVLFLSGKRAEKPADREADNRGQLHVDFGLSAQDARLFVTDPQGRTVAVAAIKDLAIGVSRGRLPDKPDTWRYFARPTPGTANTSASFTTLSQTGSPSSRRLLVSEVYAVNRTKAARPDKDWVELYNVTDKRIDLTGYGLSDTSDRPFRMKLAHVSIAPKATAVITPKTFAVSSQGEAIVLTSPSGVVEDTFATGYLRPGGSSGRRVGGSTAGSLKRVFYAKPTKGRANRGTAYKGYTGAPAVTAKKSGGGVVDGLYISRPVSVTIRAAEPNAKIHYTVNGEAPTRASPVYRRPIRVGRSLVLRAIAVRPGYLPSDPVSRTFLKEKPHSVPVVSLCGDPADLVGGHGVLTAGSSRKEAPVGFAFYEKDGRLGIDSEAGAELFGSFSRKERQRSLELKFRSGYGNSEIRYPFFGDYDVTTFHRLVLRTSGQDWKYTKVRDAFMTRVIEGRMSVDTMAVRNCVVYVNGRYWGLYEIREKLDQSYIASHHGVGPDNIDLIKGEGIVYAGSDRDMKSLINYARTHDLRKRAAYEAVLDRIDEDSLMDWIIVESFFNNTDSGNKKYWRTRTPDGQYRWMIFDLDWALFPTTYRWDCLKGDMLNPGGHGTRDMFSTTLQVSLMRNPAFREKFIRRYAKHLNTTFKTPRMLKILDESVAIIRDEMPRQNARWGVPGSMSAWNGNVASLRHATSVKRALVKGNLQEDLGLSSKKMKQLFPEDHK